jgi:hypothetical protein
MSSFATHENGAGRLSEKAEANGERSLDNKEKDRCSPT